MTHRIFAAAIAALLCFSVTSFAQEKEPVSPSDVPVEKIKNASATQEAEKAAPAKAAPVEKKPAEVKPADAKATDVKPADAKAAEATPAQETSPADAAPLAPVAEGTVVSEPACGCATAPATTSCCEPACDPCSGRGKFLSRVRSLFNRRGCR